MIGVTPLASTYPDRIVKFERARVIGGCSAHNGCAAIWGSRLDYDDWASRGLDGWSTDALLPLCSCRDASAGPVVYKVEEVTPFQQACLEAARSAGVPLTDDLNDVDRDEGMSTSPVNIDGGVRWNAAFAYLDPVRESTEPDDRGRLSGRSHHRQRRPRLPACDSSDRKARPRWQAERVVVAGGTYGSPAVLLRSGIGEPDELRALGIRPTVQLPGVGQKPARSLRLRTSCFAARRAWNQR